MIWSNLTSMFFVVNQTPDYREVLAICTSRQEAEQYGSTQRSYGTWEIEEFTWEEFLDFLRAYRSGTER